MKSVYENLPKPRQLGLSYPKDDLFICALGFEDRCITAPTKLAKAGYSSENAIYLLYDSNTEDNSRNEEGLLSALRQISAHAPVASSYRFGEPLTSLENLNVCLDALKSKISSVTVDITSFSSGAILQVLDRLMSMNLACLRVIYTEAKIYFPKDENEKSDDSLSFGLKDIITLPNFTGFHSPGYPQLLIIFLGFSVIRPRGVYNWYQPSRKVGIIGVPSRPELKWRVHKAKEIHERYFYSTDRIVDLTTFDYKEVLEMLENLYREFSQDHNIGITPLGSKMQTLGLYFFLRNHKEIQVIIPVPKGFYAKGYSEGSGQSWEIVFGSTVMTSGHPL